MANSNVYTEFLSNFFFFLLLSTPIILFPLRKVLISEFLFFSKNILTSISHIIYSNTDFILKVTPYKPRKWLGQKEAELVAPPGYRIPSRLKNKLNEKLPADYCMTLVPGALAKWYIIINFFVLILPSTVPLALHFNMEFKEEVLKKEYNIIKVNSSNINTYFEEKFKTNNTTPNQRVINFKYKEIRKIDIYFSIILLLLTILFYMRIYGSTNHPVLSEIWEKWPEPNFHMLKSVPHKVSLRRQDRKTQIFNKLPIYWNPKKNTSSLRQPRQYASDISTLQGILLNFAIFEFFFHRISDNDNLLNLRKWIYYWMSPVWVSYLILILWLVIYTFTLHFLISVDYLSKDQAQEIYSTLGFTIGIIMWIITSTYFINRCLKNFSNIKNKISSGYFNKHEELVPQSILNHLTEIPSEKKITIFIRNASRFNQFLVFGLFVNFLLILDAIAIK